MKRLILLTALILMLIAAILVAFRSFREADEPSGLQQEGAASNYLKYCSGCHGANLEKFAAKAWMDEEGT